MLYTILITTLTFLIIAQYVPYSISVSASTSVGSGNEVNVIKFTREGGMYCTVYKL